jgi:Rieske Fe-S protein
VVPEVTPHAIPSECAACPIDADRRAFVRGVGAAIVAALTLGGVRRADAMTLLAATPSPIAPTHSARDTHSYPIPAEDGVQIDAQNEVILARWQNAVYAFSLACPHQNTALRWVDSEHVFRCPKHKSTFQPDGTLVEGRAKRSMDRLSVKKEGSAIVVNLDGVYEADSDAAGWAAAVVHL